LGNGRPSKRKEGFLGRAYAIHVDLRKFRLLETINRQESGFSGIKKVTSPNVWPHSTIVRIMRIIAKQPIKIE